MLDAIKDVDEPWRARAALKELETQCQRLPVSALVQGRSAFILITSALFAIVLIDVENSSLAKDGMSVWAAISIISLGCTLVLFTWIYNKLKLYLNSKTLRAKRGTPEQNGLGIEMGGANKASTTVGAKLPTLKVLNECRTVLQTDASSYRVGVGGHELEQDVTNNPMCHLVDDIPIAAV